MTEPVNLAAGGRTHPGQVRSNNEDCLMCATDLGVYGVFDGMGGHQAGEVASAMTRDTLHAAAEAAAAAGAPFGAKEVGLALDVASSAVCDEAERRRAQRGMGTTAVVCVVRDRHVIVAHVGDSRAYLLRDGRMQQLTADHTIVAELVAKGALTEDEALTHPYRSVLSRNVGAKRTTTPDVFELDLAPGDRLLLCSDGLTGFASVGEIRRILSDAADPPSAAKELIDVALKGGGGDNVTAVILDAGAAPVPRRTQIIRTTGASQWHARRDAFLAAAREFGLASSPICAVLSPDEAVDIVAGNAFDAIYSDMEQTTGIHLWTFADNLASGWLDQAGDYAVLRDLLDVLGGSANRVIRDIAMDDPECAELLDVAVPRALIVAEMAVGAVVAKRLRVVESRIVALDTQTGSHTLADGVTVPVNVPRADPPSPEVRDCLDGAMATATERVRAESRPEEAGVVMDALQRAHRAAAEHAGQLDGASAARELFGTRSLGEPAIAPLLDALDRARMIHMRAVRSSSADKEVRAAAFRSIVTAHRLLCTSTAHMVVDAGRPLADKLRAAAQDVVALRERVGENEQQIQRLERRYSTQPGWAPKGGPA